MMERIFTDVYKQDKEWCITILRYFNPIGAHPSGDMGEDPSGLLSNLVPFLQQVAIGKQDHINVFGTDYDTPDGTCLRDYIHVMDIADGHVKALEYMESKGYKGYDVFNLGTGKGSSVFEVIRAMEKACGFELKKVLCPRRAGDRPDAVGLGRRRNKFHHDERADGDHLVEGLPALQKAVQRHTDVALFPVGAVVRHHIKTVGNRLELFFKDHEIVVAEPDDGSNVAAAFMQSARNGKRDGAPDASADNGRLRDSGAPANRLAVSAKAVPHSNARSTHAQ